jgi:carbamoyltransferase
MKLLGLRLCDHDSSISYYDGNVVRYFKSERLYQIKHVAYDDILFWKNDLQRVFNIDIDDIDEISIVYLHKIVTPNIGFFPAIDFPEFPAKCKVNWVHHHYAHSLSYWMCMDKEPDVSFIFDGEGDPDNSWTVFKNHKIIESGSTTINGSIAFSLVHACRQVGVEAQQGLDVPGKGMGLQSYGKIDYEYLNYLQKYSIYENRLIVDIRGWEVYLNNDKLLMQHRKLDWLATVHYRLGELLLDYFKKYANKEDTIVYGGGVAQNIIWNTMLKKEFPNLIILPHCADDGLSLGALEYSRIKNNLPKLPLVKFPYSQEDKSPDDLPTEETILKTAKLLAEGKIVAWYQEHGEIGPRALGNRSILMDPRLQNGKSLINKIKRREYYRPFGACVLDEHREEDFDLKYENPYMLYVAEVKNKKYPAITHVDNTCRVQTVSKNCNSTIRRLLEQFYKLTNCPVLLNTSLNISGKPIAGWPQNAEEEFNISSIDVLVIGNKISQKT